MHFFRDTYTIRYPLLISLSNDILSVECGESGRHTMKPGSCPLPKHTHTHRMKRRRQRKKQELTSTCTHRLYSPSSTRMKSVGSVYRLKLEQTQLKKKRPISEAVNSLPRCTSPGHFTLMQTLMGRRRLASISDLSHMYS